MRRIMKKVRIWLFNYHWTRINSMRHTAVKLIDAGVECSDSRLVALSNAILRHGLKVSSLWQQHRTQGCEPHSLYTEDSAKHVPV